MNAPLNRSETAIQPVQDACGGESPLLRISGLSKNFDEIPVLKNLTMDVFPREIVGLVGENGAGKSTLLNILSGTITDYSGAITFGGRPLRLRGPADAARVGISRVFQEPALVPNLPVYANLTLSHENLFSTLGFLNKRKMIEAAEKQLAEIGVTLDVTAETGSLDIATRQVIEIARACSLARILGAERALILLDEPTASLSQHEIEPFFNLIRRLKHSASFILVSHRLSECLDLCDRIIVLKDGAIAASAKASELDVGKLHELMVGRARAVDYYRDALTTSPGDGPILRVKDVGYKKAFTGVSFDVAPGEIVSIVGVLGSGKHELGASIVGHRPPDSGSVFLGDDDVTRFSYRKHLERGVGYTPGERQRFGVVGTMCGRENISLSSIEDYYARWSILRLAKERRETVTAYEAVNVLPANPEIQVRNLSGGNQQKVLLSRSIIRRPRVLVLDNPTAAVDAGVKEQLYELMRELSAHGCAIVLISDDLLEAIHMATRIIVMKNGEVSSTFEAPVGAKPAERDIVAYMV
jgi:ribose transport system ATP-binding protein